MFIVILIFSSKIVSFHFLLMPTSGILFDYLNSVGLVLRCSSWLNLSNIFILISLHCCHSLWILILKIFIVLLWMIQDVLFNIVHTCCNCLLVVRKAKSNLKFKLKLTFWVFHIYCTLLKGFLCNNNFFIFSLMLNSNVSLCFTIFVMDYFLTKIHRLFITFTLYDLLIRLSTLKLFNQR